MATPDQNSPQVKAFIRKFLGGAKPVWVPQRPSDDGVLSECFANVSNMVESFGGRMILGWHLWEMPGLMLEGEFHAVWLRPSGTMVDVSPQPAGFEEERILFVPRHHLRYFGQRPRNLRLLLADDPDLNRLVELKDSDARAGRIEPYRDQFERRIEMQSVLVRLATKFPGSVVGIPKGS